MDMLEDAITTAQELISEAVGNVSNAASSEVYCFCEAWQERYHNHYISFDDGMGSKTFHVYRKHDRKPLIIVGDGWSKVKPNVYEEHRYFHKSSPIQEIIDFMKDLTATLDGANMGYINLEAYNLPDKFEG